jgi:hypothetical protein
MRHRLERTADAVEIGQRIGNHPRHRSRIRFNVGAQRLNGSES